VDSLLWRGVNAGYGRAITGASPKATRYVHIVAASVLPALAVAAGAFVRRWRYLLPFAAALFLVGIPGNVVAITAHGTDAYTLGSPNLILSIPRALCTAEFPGAFHPHDAGSPGDMARLRDGLRTDGSRLRVVSSRRADAK
jgi:hypothetical protein